MLAPNQGVRIAFDCGFEAFVGCENQRATGVSIERVGSEADCHMQKEELFGLPDSARFEVGLKPTNDLHYRTGARAIEADDESVVIPAPSNVFPPESAVHQAAQIRPQASRLDVVEPIEACRLQKANRIGAPVTLRGRKTDVEGGDGPGARE